MTSTAALELVIRLRDETEAQLRQIKRELGDLGNAAASADRQSRSLFGGIMQTAGGVLTANVLGNLAGGFTDVFTSAIDMNAQLETTTLQFETLMGSAEDAQAQVKFLFDFAKRTPFETGPIIQASKLLQTFGGAALNSEKNLTLLGDAAAATSAPIDELGFWTGRLYSALQAGKPFGEASARLTELAVVSPQAIQQMEELQKAGASADEIFAVFQSDLERFGGAMEKQAGTWQGLVSTFKDTFAILSAQALAPLFDLAKQGLTELNAALSDPAVQAAIQNMANWLAEKIPQAITVIGGFITTILIPGFSAVWSFITGSLIPALGTIADVITATVIPALIDAWNWFNNNILPTLQNVAGVFSGDLSPAVSEAAGVWSTTLAPALSDIWDIFSTKILPVIGDVISEMGDLLGWVGKVVSSLQGPFVLALGLAADVVRGLITGFGELVEAVKIVLDFGARLLGGFISLRDAVTGVIGKIADLGLKLLTLPLQVPSWLIPGSPTPFEVGLRGIADAMQSVGRNITPMAPAFATVGGAAPPMPGAGGGASLAVGGGRSVTINLSNVTVDSRERIDQLVAAVKAAFEQDVDDLVGQGVR